MMIRYCHSWTHKRCFNTFCIGGTCIYVAELTSLFYNMLLQLDDDGAGGNDNAGINVGGNANAATAIVVLAAKIMQTYDHAVMAQQQQSTLPSGMAVQSNNKSNDAQDLCHSAGVPHTYQTISAGPPSTRLTIFFGCRCSPAPNYARIGLTKVVLYL
jgi:hypothetical protein